MSNPILDLLKPEQLACPLINLPVFQLSKTLDKNGKPQMEFIPCIQNGCKFWDSKNNDCKINIVLQLTINEYADTAK